MHFLNLNSTIALLKNKTSRLHELCLQIIYDKLAHFLAYCSQKKYIFKLLLLLKHNKKKTLYQTLFFKSLLFMLNNELTDILPRKHFS